MAHSLESRVPFLDPEVAELALALPTPHKVRGLAKKRLLRKALAPLLPKEIVRARKRGFAMPVAAWFRGPLLLRARDALARDAVAAGLARPRRGHGGDRRALLGPRGPEPQHLGPDRLHALARPLRRPSLDSMPASVEALLAFLVAGILTLLLVPATIRLARRAGAIDLPGVRSLHAVPTPKLGGLAIFAGVLDLRP